MPAKKEELSSVMRKEALKWRILIDNNDLEPEEHKELEEWLKADSSHKQALDRAQTVLSAFGKLDERVIEKSYIKKSHLDRLRYAIADFKERSMCIQTGSSLTVGVAAVFAICFILSTHFLGKQRDESVDTTMVSRVYNTGIGETTTFQLPDDSVLTLGPSTQIEVSFSKKFRSVKLDRGAVVFDVRSDADRPFSVKANDFSARVLGTVFDMRNNGGVTRLSVAEGAVQVQHPIIINDSSIGVMSVKRLSAGEAIYATRNTGLSEQGSFSRDSFAAWRESRLHYNGATLNELVADANRYSQKPISIEASSSTIQRLKVTFTYNASDLDTMLTSLPNLFSVEIDRSDDDVIVIRPLNDGK